MIEFNDSNASYSQNGLSIFVDDIKVEEDIFISSSCVFLSDVVTTGKIRAQYSVLVQGKLVAGDDIDVGGDLQCFQVKAINISIGGGFTVKDDVTCSNLFVSGNVICGSIYCTNIDVEGSLIATNMVDAAENIRINKALVSLDFVQASGCISAEEVIAVDISAEEENVNKKVYLTAELPNKSPEVKGLQPISESDFTEIFDAHSSLAITIEDCAMFFDRLNIELCGLSLVEEIQFKYLRAFAGFFPEYLSLLEILTTVSPVLFKEDIDEESWFKDFNTCAAALLKLPSWYQESQVSKALCDKINELLLYQSNHDLTTKSFSEWTVTNYYNKLLKDYYKEEPAVCTLLQHLHERLLSNIGLKVPFYNLLFTQE